MQTRSKTSPKPKHADPCLELIQASWRLPKFRRYALLNLHCYWIDPLREFYVSYDYLKTSGFFDAVLQPYANIFPILFKMFKKDDAYMRSMTGHPKDRFNPEAMADLIPLAKTEGRQYLKVFSNSKLRNQLLNIVTTPILFKFQLDESEYRMLWSDIDYTARCVPNACPPFLMTTSEYKEHLTALITKQRGG